MRPDPCPELLPSGKTFFEGTGIIKMRLRFFAGGMCEWHVRSNTPARQTDRICSALSCLVLRGDTSGLETPALL